MQGLLFNFTNLSSLKDLEKSNIELRFHFWHVPDLFLNAVEIFETRVYHIIYNCQK